MFFCAARSLTRCLVSQRKFTVALVSRSRIVKDDHPRSARVSIVARRLAAVRSLNSCTKCMLTGGRLCSIDEVACCTVSAVSTRVCVTTPSLQATDILLTFWANLSGPVPRLSLWSFPCCSARRSTWWANFTVSLSKPPKKLRRRGGKPHRDPRALCSRLASSPWRVSSVSYKIKAFRDAKRGQDEGHTAAVRRREAARYVPGAKRSDATTVSMFAVLIPLGADVQSLLGSDNHHTV